jgi:hypothetical protein
MRCYGVNVDIVDTFLNIVVSTMVVKKPPHGITFTTSCFASAKSHLGYHTCRLYEHVAFDNHAMGRGRHAAKQH